MPKIRVTKKTYQRTYDRLWTKYYNLEFTGHCDGCGSRGFYDLKWRLVVLAGAVSNRYKEKYGTYLSYERREPFIVPCPIHGVRMPNEA